MNWKRHKPRRKLHGGTRRARDTYYEKNFRLPRDRRREAAVKDQLDELLEECL